MLFPDPQLSDCNLRPRARARRITGWPSYGSKSRQRAVSGVRFRPGSAMRWLPGIMRLEALAWIAISFAIASASFPTGACARSARCADETLACCVVAADFSWISKMSLAGTGRVIVLPAAASGDSLGHGACCGNGTAPRASRLGARTISAATSRPRTNPILQARAMSPRGQTRNWEFSASAKSPRFPRPDATAIAAARSASSAVPASPAPRGRCDSRAPSVHAGCAAERRRSRLDVMQQQDAFALGLDPLHCEIV